MDLPRIPERKLTAEVESVTKETKSSEFALRLSGSDAVEFLSPEKSENPFPCTNQEALVSGTNRERESYTERDLEGGIGHRKSSRSHGDLGKGPE